MTIGICRECKDEVSTEALLCPQCGAPKPVNHEYNGTGFEWRSKQEFMKIPLIHIAVGRDKKHKLRIAKGWIAIGQFAVGAVTFAQFGVGFIFGFGQFIAGWIAIAQFAGALYFGLGQFATGYICIGQFVLGYYGLAQAGFAQFLWSPKMQDPVATEFFKTLWHTITSYIQQYISF